MTGKNYPEEIYETRDGLTMTLKQRDGHGGQARRRAYDLGYRDGRFKERLEASNPLAGWSNLTEAIKAGERIDWDALDGLEARCVHPEMGMLTYKLERDIHFSITSSSGWCVSYRPRAWGNALYYSWHGKGDWSLWVKGDLPLHKQTADQLAPGTCFVGRQHGGVRCLYIRYSMPFLPVGKSRERACPLSASFTVPAEDVEVLHVYEEIGTFEKPEENQ